MLCKVTHCAGRVSANTRSHAVKISCTNCDSYSMHLLPCLACSLSANRKWHEYSVKRTMYLCTIHTHLKKCIPLSPDPHPKIKRIWDDTSAPAGHTMMYLMYLMYLYGMHVVSSKQTHAQKQKRSETISLGNWVSETISLGNWVMYDGITRIKQADAQK